MNLSFIKLIIHYEKCARVFRKCCAFRSFSIGLCIQGMEGGGVKDEDKIECHLLHNCMRTTSCHIHAINNENIIHQQRRRCY